WWNLPTKNLTVQTNIGVDGQDCKLLLENSEEEHTRDKHRDKSNEAFALEVCGEFGAIHLHPQNNRCDEGNDGHNICQPIHLYCAGCQKHGGDHNDGNNCNGRSKKLVLRCRVRYVVSCIFNGVLTHHDVLDES